MDTITNETGAVVQRLSYDAFGKRRNANGTDATTITAQTTRGFTRHEHDDEVGLVNMNAREYDPLLGRFATPDTLVQFAHYSQSYNRYSYVHNNPLSFTDPTGRGLGKWLKKTVKKYGKTIVAAVAAYYSFNYVSNWMQAGVSTTGASTSFASAGTFIGTDTAGGFFATSLTTAGGAVAGASSGFVAGGILSGNFQGAWNGATGGAISGGLFAEANYLSRDWNRFGQITARSTAGGLSAQFQGGDFSNGFQSGFITGSGAWAYEKIVGYGATWRPGGAEAMKERYTPPVAGANNFGIQWTKDTPNWWDKLFWEGGPVSKVMNMIPGVNAGAGMHDTFQVVSDAAGGNLLRNIVNLPGIPIAALMTAPALFDPLMPFAYLSDIK